MSRNLSTKHLLLPVFYFFLLSLATVVASSYWLLKLVVGSEVSYAQEDFSSNIQVVSGTENLLTVTNADFCDDPIADKIDGFFKDRKAPLAGEGCNFVNHANLNAVEPTLVPAIAWCESNGGRVTPQFGNQESYNAWGWAVYDSNETTKQVDGYGCSSWEECIGRVTRGLARKSDRGLAPADIVQWYTPASVAKGGGVPENAPWVQCVTTMMGVINEFEIN